jgi:hypothetical protein
MTTFTKQELVDALKELGSKAVEAGKVIDLLIYGGSCLMLVSNFRMASEDVDAVAVEDQGFIDQAARAVAAARGWPHDWLNDGVRAYTSPKVDGTEHHELVGSYPDEATPGLRVFVPTVEYMLAMKLMALRVGPGPDGDKDLHDILNLMQVVGLENKSDIVDFAAHFYPEARISGKLRLAIDDLWKRYEAHKAVRLDEPPQYFGRTGAPREG